MTPMPTPGTRLTETECRVVELVAEGMTNEEISGVLFTTLHTVRSHLARASRRLGARNRAHVVARAACTGQWWPQGADSTVVGVNAAWAKRVEAETRARRKAESQRDAYRVKYLKALETIMEFREREKG